MTASVTEAMTKSFEPMARFLLEGTAHHHRRRLRAVGRPSARRGVQTSCRASAAPGPESGNGRGVPCGSARVAESRGVRRQLVHPLMVLHRAHLSGSLHRRRYRCQPATVVVDFVRLSVRGLAALAGTSGTTPIVHSCRSDSRSGVVSASPDVLGPQPLLRSYTTIGFEQSD